VWAWFHPQEQRWPWSTLTHVDEGSPTTHELREQWRKAEARTELFERNSLLWREAREEADVARRAYERRLRTLSKREGSGNP
jgi:hypothetical protein